MPDSVYVGERGRLLVDIYDDGEDHHPPGFIGLKGQVVVVREIRQSLSGSKVRYIVSHPEVTDNGFLVYPHEIELIAGS